VRERLAWGDTRNTEEEVNNLPGRVTSSDFEG